MEKNINNNQLLSSNCFVSFSQQVTSVNKCSVSSKWDWQKVITIDSKNVRRSFLCPALIMMLLVTPYYLSTRLLQNFARTVAQFFCLIIIQYARNSFCCCSCLDIRGNFSKQIEYAVYSTSYSGINKTAHLVNWSVYLNNRFE